MSKNTKCPCGCGATLSDASGWMGAVACPGTWSMVAPMVQDDLHRAYIAGALSVSGGRVNCDDSVRPKLRLVLDLARAVREQRPPVPKQQELFAFAGRRGA